MNYIASVGRFLLNTDMIYSRWKELALSWRATLNPESFRYRVKKDLAPEEEEKLVRIQEQISLVAKSLQIPSTISFSAEISEADDSICILGNTLFEAKPRIFIPKKDFENYERPVDPIENQEWKELVDTMPDHPTLLGQFLDQADFDTRIRIQELAEKNSIYDTSELSAVIAHELGHAKYYHVLQRDAISAFFITFMEQFLPPRSLDTKDPLSSLCSLACLAVSIYLFDYGKSTPLARQFSRYCEGEADLETAASPEYIEGLISRYKRRLILSLNEVPSGSREEKVQSLLTSQDFFRTHPNDAKRLWNAVQLRGKSYTPPSLLSSMGRGVMVSIPLLLAARDVYNFALFAFQFL